VQLSHVKEQKGLDKKGKSDEWQTVAENWGALIKHALIDETTAHFEHLNRNAKQHLKVCAQLSMISVYCPLATKKKRFKLHNYDGVC